MKPSFACVRLLACLVCVATAHSASPQEPPAPSLDLDAIDAYLEAQVAARRLPGLAAVIVDGEEVVLARGYGSAGGGRPVTPQTQFYIGSCTKSFTALAVMLLVERGRLDLDAPVQRYLPEFRVADRAASAEIRVRHLLNQTSGLSESGDPQPHRPSASLREAALSLGRVRQTAPLGESFQYYNPNYRVLGHLIERVSGQSYEAYLRDHILTPLAMRRTVADPSAAEGLAQGHADVFGWPMPRPQGFDPGALSSGYLISTVEDLAHYLVALLNDGRYGDTAIVQPDTLAELFTPPNGVDSSRAIPPAAVTALLGAPGGVESGYGMGWLVARSSDGRRLVFHAGSLERFRADILLVPEQKRGLVILVNQNGILRPLLDPNPPWMGVAHLMLGRAGPPPPPGRFRAGVFLLVVGIDLGIGVFRLWRLPRWRDKALTRSRGARWSRASLDALLPGAFLAFFPALLGRVVGAEVTWLGFFDFLPDVAIWFVASAALGLTRGVAKAMILAAGARR
jgi:CubicO group peptidase (beta-lactamase class C family)